MLQGIIKRLNLLLALPDLAVKLITVPLQLLLLLTGLDHVVRLAVLASCLHLARARFVPLAKPLVLDAQVFDFILAHLKFNCYLVALFLGSLLLADQDVLVHLNLLFTLLHRHLQLVLPVFKPVHGVCLLIDGVPQGLNLKLHDVMLNECLLLGVLHLREFNSKLFVFNLDVLEFIVKFLLLGLDLLDLTFDVPAFILKSLVAVHQLAAFLFNHGKRFLSLFDVLVQLGLFFLTPLALSSGDLPFLRLD